MGGEAFGPVKAHFPNIGEGQGAEVERDHLHGGKGGGRGDEFGVRDNI